MRTSNLQTIYSAKLVIVPFVIILGITSFIFLNDPRVDRAAKYVEWMNAANASTNTSPSLPEPLHRWVHLAKDSFGELSSYEFYGFERSSSKWKWVRNSLVKTDVMIFKLFFSNYMDEDVFLIMNMEHGIKESRLQNWFVVSPLYAKPDIAEVIRKGYPEINDYLKLNFPGIHAS